MNLETKCSKLAVPELIALASSFEIDGSGVHFYIKKGPYTATVSVGTEHTAGKVSENETYHVRIDAYDSSCKGKWSLWVEVVNTANMIVKAARKLKIPPFTLSAN